MEPSQKKYLADLLNKLRAGDLPLKGHVDTSRPNTTVISSPVQPSLYRPTPHQVATPARTPVSEKLKQESRVPKGKHIIFDISSGEDLEFDEEKEDKENKENITSGNQTPSRSGSSRSFLERGQEKSQESLRATTAKQFYGAGLSTPREYGGFAYRTRINKRNPGFLSDPHPAKRSRLADDALSYTWKSSKPSLQAVNKQQSELQGFSNLGNTCYMNAILQSLYGLEPFAADLLKTKSVFFKMMNKDPPSLYLALYRLLLAKKRQGKSPEKKRELLRNVKQAISSSAKRFSGNEQHDAHEFLCQVIDQLKEEVIKANAATPSPDPKDKNMFMQSSIVNPTVQNFEFEVLHTIQCQECKEEVSKAEQFNDLSLDMPKRRKDQESPPTIQDSLDQFFRREFLEYKCEKCGASKAQVTHKFTKLPRIIILHLKRYHFHVGNSMQAKSGRSVGIPKFLTLQKHCLEETTPPYPAAVPSAIQSPRKTALDEISLENQNQTITDTPRRRLDYPVLSSEKKYKFQRIRPPASDSDNDSVQKVLELSKHETSKEDMELKKAIELSKMENVKGPSANEAEELDRAIQLSLGKAEKTAEALPLDLGSEAEKQMSSELDRHESQFIIESSNIESLSEEDQLQAALEMSLQEAEDLKNSQDPETGSTLQLISEHNNIDMDNVAFDDVSNTENPFQLKGGSKESVLDYYDNQIDTRQQEKQDVQVPNSKRKSEAVVHDLPPEIIISSDTAKSSSEHEIDFTSSTPLKMTTQTYSLKNLKRSVEKKPPVTETKEKESHNESKDPDWIRDHQRMQEDEAMKEAIKKSIEDMKEQPRDFDKDLEDEQLRKAMELSLKDAYPDGVMVNYDTDEEDIENESTSDSDDKWYQEKLKHNMEQGDMPYSYRLMSIVNHLGSNSSFGHYNSDVYDLQKKSWYSYDDIEVAKVSERRVRTDRATTGYIFFYMSKEIVDEQESAYKSLFLEQKSVGSSSI
ncbi:ubiquitin carboxyl-terminal hydrolase 37-like isoform X1 [Lingula anatina]|uniref:Ubiquitin carboxyl-terminal hydrolase n=1 Tax=Lingula anatina TaxID=7574 RepID=A0A2R2MSS4_LINAN|nr:ubiquitin carboxyl-terminal hydrolase 37-like isoform X1 [Lingula anatina]XP_023933294.1 ubiquitin carboxyl-terminal hydrolase 37-like isoform X1 [Lingula anatina]|eukprot:XP_023933293.1 ubiquitin carboxyl-terminal hydrolase 37-like isoform X1 [Lingula anatina]